MKKDSKNSDSQKDNKNSDSHEDRSFALELYGLLNSNEANFARMQTVYRGLHFHLFAILAGVLPFLLSGKLKEFEHDAWISASILCFLFALISGIFWYVDVVTTHNLMSAIAIEELRAEKKYSYLPQARTIMTELVGDSVTTAYTLIYFLPYCIEITLGFVLAGVSIYKIDHHLVELTFAGLPIFSLVLISLWGTVLAASYRKMHHTVTRFSKLVEKFVKERSSIK